MCGIDKKKKRFSKHFFKKEREGLRKRDERETGQILQETTSQILFLSWITSCDIVDIGIHRVLQNH